LSTIENDSGLPIKPVYSSEDRPADEPQPGTFPFTRGIHKDMYRGRLWTMRQYAGFGTAAESNKRYKFLLKQGQTGLSVAFDLPTQIGYDSDDPMANGEVGKVGVAIDSLEDMETLLDGIPLEKVSTSMTINATATMLLLLYQLVAEKQGCPPEKITGTVQNDILKEYAARGTYIFPPKPSIFSTYLFPDTGSRGCGVPSASTKLSTCSAAPRNPSSESVMESATTVMLWLMSLMLPTKVDSRFSFSIWTLRIDGAVFWKSRT